VSSLAGEQLAVADTLGVVAGLVAVVMVAYVPGSSLLAAGTRGPLFAAAAGVSFGLFFVALDATPADSGLWPLLGSRSRARSCCSCCCPSPAAGSRPAERSGWRWSAACSTWPPTCSSCSRPGSGLLSLVSLLASLYPVVVLLLARQVLHERLTRLQAAGVALALAATALIVT
jgi:drug/metabolite transporter (DMT)-like permease